MSAVGAAVAVIGSSLPVLPIPPDHKSTDLSLQVDPAAPANTPLDLAAAGIIAGGFVVTNPNPDCHVRGTIVAPKDSSLNGCQFIVGKCGSDVKNYGNAEITDIQLEFVKKPAAPGVVAPGDYVPATAADLAAAAPEQLCIDVDLAGVALP